ncbi:DUF2806 domain-containing protein [Desulfovibrio piger]
MWPSVLAENVSKGLGKLGELMLGKYFRQKEYQDFLMRAQAEKDALAIASGEKVFDGEKLLPAWDLSHMPASSLPHLIGLEEEINNLNATLKITADILKDTSEEDIADEAVNPDWFTRWRREARVISTSEMQVLWGRILAEEIKSPQTISLRTLDVLKNVTAQEAHLFVAISTFVLNGMIICSERRLPYGFTFDDILALNDAGLLVNAMFIRNQGIRDESGFRRFEGTGYWLYIQCPRKISPIEGVALSNAGMEILKIADKKNATRSEITDICDIIRSSTPGNIQSMRAVLPGHPYQTLEEMILYRYPYVSSRKKSTHYR